MSKRFLSVFLSICMIIPAFSGMSAYAVGEETEAALSASDPMSQVPAENAYEKIHFYFDTAEYANLESTSELATATASVKTDYAAALGVAQRRSTDADVNENVYITVQFVSDYMEDETYKTLKAARENAKTADERDEAKTNMNRYSKQYHADLVAENLPTLSAISYTAFHAIDYSSFVTLTVPANTLDTAVLEEVAHQDNILHISLTDGFDAVADSGTYAETNSSKTRWQDVLECINADDIVGKVYNGTTYTGEGVKVGVYESSGDNACDLAVPQISALGSRFHFREHNDIAYDWETTTHATKVVSVLVAMIPNADFYFARVPVQMVADMQEGVSWFISQGCDVVNCSFGFDSYGIYRHDIDAVYDYQIYYNDIVVVKSSGNIEINDENTYITSPGLGHNVITVGGVRYNSTSGWNRASQSRYLNPSITVKPNVVAPFHMYIPGVITDESDSSPYGLHNSGTSFSAPLVTSCVALYQEYFYSNISSYLPQVQVRSVVMASANKTATYQSEGSNYFADDKVGAGIIDLKKMLSYDMRFNVFTIQNPGLWEVASYSINLTADDELKVALSWNVQTSPTTFNNMTGGSVTAPEFDLYLYDSMGHIVAKSLYTGNGVEYIRYTALSPGNYRIAVIHPYYGDSSLQLAIAYCAEGGE